MRGVLTTAVSRDVYRSPDEIRSAWARETEKMVKSLDKFKLLRRGLQGVGRKWGRPDTAEPPTVEKFLEAFDPTQHYTNKWWGKMLGLSLGREWHLSMPSNSTEQFAVREPFKKMLSFSVPSSETLKSIAEFVGDAPVVEYFSGTGYWAYLLKRDFGVRVTATDINEAGGFDVSKAKTFLPVYRLNARNARALKHVAVMMMWVPYESVAANRVLRQMKPGQKLVYVGEGEGGCTAADSTYELLDKNFEHAGGDGPPQFFGLHDHLRLYVRK
jgi:hypothetical protein